MTDAGYGQLDPSDTASEFAKDAFLIRQTIALIATAKFVKVMNVAPGNSGANMGADAPTGPIGNAPLVGWVDVLPLVNQIDGVGNATPHEIVYKFPFFRLQGGLNAILCDPVVGDIGLAVIADRDSSVVKATQAQANPGSFRRFSLADGVYLGTVLSGTPIQGVSFVPDGVKIFDKNGNVIYMQPGMIVATTPLFAVTGDVVSQYGTENQISLTNHQQQNGGGTGLSGPPEPGT